MWFSMGDAGAGWIFGPNGMISYGRWALESSKRMQTHWNMLGLAGVAQRFVRFHMQVGRLGPKHMKAQGEMPGADLARCGVVDRTVLIKKRARVWNTVEV